MSKAVVCILVATAIVLLIIIFGNSNPNCKHKNFIPILGRRFGWRSRFPVFDPFVVDAQVQRRDKEQKQSKSRRSEEEKYYKDDGSLNLRLMVLFPFLDISPQDGTIDSKELDAWLMQQTIDTLHVRLRRELELLDKDGDGAISFFEYLPQFKAEDVERNDNRHGKAGWWMEQFNNADLDRNGALNLYEFRDFTHPEDSRNEQIHRWLLMEKIRLMDKDNDSKLNLLEFKNGVYNTYKTYFEYESAGELAPSPEDVFSKLDMDKDRSLRIEELKPTFRYLCPGELAYSKYYTIHLMNQADDNRDGRLTLEEMLNHEYIFYNSVYENNRYYEDYHDEL